MTTSSFDTITGLTTTDTAGQMLAVGSEGLHQMQASGLGCTLSSATALSGFSDPQGIAHVPGSSNVWVAFGDGKIAEFRVSLGSTPSAGVTGKTTLELEPGQQLVMDWSTSKSEGILGAGDLSDLTFTWTQDGATRFQDNAILDSMVQPIGGVIRSLDDIRFNFDLETEMLIDGAGSGTAWDNDFFSVQTDQAMGETARFEGALIPTKRALIAQLVDGQVTSSMDFPSFTQASEIFPNAVIPEPSTLVGGLISVLAGCGYRLKRRVG